MQHGGIEAERQHRFAKMITMQVHFVFLHSPQLQSPKCTEKFKGERPTTSLPIIISKYNDFETKTCMWVMGCCLE